MATDLKTKSIYLIGPEGGGPIKIGIGTNPKKRLDDLQTGSHKRLLVLWTYDVQAGHALAIEQRTHRRLREHRLYGEWFDVPPAVAADTVLEVAREVAAGKREPKLYSLPHLCKPRFPRPCDDPINHANHFVREAIAAKDRGDDEATVDAMFAHAWKLLEDIMDEIAGKINPSRTRGARRKRKPARKPETGPIPSAGQ